MNTLLADGTVRTQFTEDERSEAARRKGLLAQALGELNVSGHRVWMVERMLETLEEPEAQSDEATWHARVALAALVAAVGQGSTGLPLEAQREIADGNDESFRTQVKTLLETARRVDDAAESPGDAGLGMEVEAVVDGFAGRLDAYAGLVGGPEDYVPVVNEVGALYTHKMAAMEARVAREIGALIEDDAADGADESRALREPVTDAMLFAMDEVLGAMPFAMDDREREEKRDALATVLGGRFGVISGGAGSGKTTLVLAVLRVLACLSPEDGGLEPAQMALAAPTGKAAHRLGESIDAQIDDLDDAAPGVAAAGECADPQTLHRLLEYSPYYGEFRRGSDRPLDARLVVVDEASMVGLELMDALLAALPEDGRLLLVGDAGQLPSVQAGAVFHDLSLGERRPAELVERVVELEGSYRTADEEGAERVLGVANAVRSEEPTHVQGLAADGVMQLCEGAEAVSEAAGVRFGRAPGNTDADGADDEARDRFLAAWWETHYGFLTPGTARQSGDVPDYRRQNLFVQDAEGQIEPAAAQRLEPIFDAVDAAQLLCITRQRVRGARAINRVMHHKYLDQNDLDKPVRFAPGEPVIITQNDYEEGVFNGDQGVVVYTEQPGVEPAEERIRKQVVVRDGDGFRAVPFDRVRDKLQHAYALTVHKSQGSEYRHVGLMLPRMLGEGAERSAHPLVTREILYTGVTRAKASVALFGAAEAFDAGVERSAGRYSGVGRRLAEGSGTGNGERETG